MAEMQNPKKKSIKMPNTAYEIYHFHKEQIYYPMMLSSFLLNSDSQFECNRAVRLLCDFLNDFKIMNQILKHKFANQLPKVLKNLCTLYQKEADINVCLAPYYYQFYTQWQELTQLIASDLTSGKKYALKFLWYLSFDFCQKIDAQRQYDLNVHLSKHFQKPLLAFENQDQMTFKRLLQTIRMINIQKDKVQFVEDAQLWAEKILKIYKKCTVESLKVQILIEIVGCRVFLLPKPATAQFWLAMVDLYFKEIQKRLPNICLANQIDLKLLDWLTLIIHFEQIQNYLLKDKKRFLQSLISKMKKSPDPKNAFHYEKYFSLRRILTNLFYFKNKQQSIKQMEQILVQFNRKAFSILKDNEQNIHFFDCMCEMKLPITKNNINQLIKSLANAHTRKSFPVHVLIILVRILHAASDQQISEQNINSIIKSLSECIASKINDPDIFTLRLEISRFYITLAQKYMWNDQKSTEIMLLWCQQFERNNKLSTPESIIIMRILTKKHTSTVFSYFSHKIEPLITDITYKLKFNKVYNNVCIFVSLLITLYLKVNWKMSHNFVMKICSQNPEDITFLYLLQSQILIRGSFEEDAKLQKRQIDQIRFIVGQKELWKNSSRVNAYLLCIEMLFSKISKQQAYTLVRELDENVQKLFVEMFQEGIYHPIIHLAAKMFFRIGNLGLLKSLKSYNFFKNISFQILSKSFHKQTIILMTYMYCMLMNKADNLEVFFAELNEQKFLNNLFQGCDQFIGKSPKFYQEQCYIILFTIKAKNNIKISGHSLLMNAKEIQKNVVWWSQSKNWVSFRLPQEEASQSLTVLIEEFKEYYEEQVRNYFVEEIQNLTEGKKCKTKKETQTQEENYDL